MTGADFSEELMVDLNEELAKEVVPGAEVEADFDFTDEDLAEIDVDPEGDLEIEFEDDLADLGSDPNASDFGDVSDEDTSDAATEFMAELAADGQAERTQALPGTGRGERRP